MTRWTHFVCGFGFLAVPAADGDLGTSLLLPCSAPATLPAFIAPDCANATLHPATMCWRPAFYVFAQWAPFFAPKPLGEVKGAREYVIRCPYPRAE